jgi:hypothetical protein
MITISKDEYERLLAVEQTPYAPSSHRCAMRVSASRLAEN